MELQNPNMGLRNVGLGGLKLRGLLRFVVSLQGSEFHGLGLRSKALEASGFN